MTIIFAIRDRIGREVAAATHVLIQFPSVFGFFGRTKPVPYTSASNMRIAVETVFPGNRRQKLGRDAIVYHEPLGKSTIVARTCTAAINALTAVGSKGNTRMIVADRDFNKVLKLIIQIGSGSVSLEGTNDTTIDGLMAGYPTIRAHAPARSHPDGWTPYRVRKVLEEARAQFGFAGILAATAHFDGAFNRNATLALLYGVGCFDTIDRPFFPPHPIPYSSRARQPAFRRLFVPPIRDVRVKMGSGGGGALMREAVERGRDWRGLFLVVDGNPAASSDIVVVPRFEGHPRTARYIRIPRDFILNIDEG